MSDRRKAQNFIEAARGGAPVEGSGAELAVLLGTVQLLRESAPAPAKPTEAFSSRLRADLLSRYGELTAGKPVAPARKRAVRWAWVAAPALAAAAALVLILVLGVFRTPPPPAVAVLEMSQGKATVVDADGKSRVVEDTSDIALDETIDVDSKSRAVLTFTDDNIARMEAGTSARVDGYEEGSITLELDRGKVYNRVIKNTRYRVIHSGVTTSARGTAFDVEVQGSGETINVFEGAVHVSWTGARPLEVGQGSQAVVTRAGGGVEAQVKPIDLATLDFSWLAYNRDLDRKAGFPLGILENLAPTPPQGVQPPALVIPPPEQTAPTTPQGTTPVDTQPTTTPTTQPTTPVSRPSASVSLASSGPPVVISWGGANVESADSVVVFRSPGGQLAVYKPGQADSFSDGNVEGGATYSYWVEYIAGGQTLAKSNAVTVTVPAPEPPPPPPPDLSVSLDGSASASSMSLKWGSSGGPLPDTWMVLRSEGAPPSYPGSVYAEVGGGSAGGSFTDYKVDGSRKYIYKVAALVRGEVIAYSNAVYYP